MSDIFKEYKVPHAGLKKEIHEFTYELTEKFFSEFENSQIEKCNIQVNVTFDKRHEPFIIDVDLDGTVFTECDRCTANIPISVHSSFKVYVKYTIDEALIDLDDVEIIYIAKDEQDIDITQFLYDYVHLSIPIHRICDKPGQTEYCDKEIVRLLEERQQENIKDPRWADLDKLKDKLN